MTIVAVESARYRLPLRSRFAAGGVDITHRDGILVRLTDAEGRTGHGDIAPLPGLHRESLEEAEIHLAQLAPRLIGASAGEEPTTFAAAAAALEARTRADGEPALASVAFGLDAALAGLLAVAADTVPVHVLRPGNEVVASARLPLAALFAGTSHDAEDPETLEALRAFPVVKVKVGRQDPSEDGLLLQTLCRALPQQVLLRIDGNRSLTLDEALRMLEAVPPERIAYLEEPLVDPRQLTLLHARTGMGMGLDETLRDPHYADLPTSDAVVAWIVKPSLVGSFSSLSALARAAFQANKQFVISSAFESGLGLWHLAQLAGALSRGAPAGLGTDRWLAEDLVSPRFDTGAGFLDLEAWQGAPSAQAQAHLTFRRLA